MYITQVTKSDFGAWVKKSHSVYSVLMVKLPECGPCKKAYPKYVELAQKYAKPKSQFQFGEYTIEKEDRTWVSNFLQVKSTPSFIVFDDWENKLFHISFAKNITDLDNYLAMASLDV